MKSDGTINQKTAEAALSKMEIDSAGFDSLDRKLLRLIIEKFGGGPVGIETLATAVGEEKDALEDVYEPYLIQEGYLDRTPRGRMATALAFRHFGLKREEGQGRFW